MVGIPKSNGCQTCRKRKKKVCKPIDGATGAEPQVESLTWRMQCDERRPACSECVRAGWLCPGYDRRWKFVEENKQLAKRYRRNSPCGNGSSGACNEGTRILARGPAKFGEKRLELHEAEKLGNGLVQVGIFWPLSSRSDRDATLFISIIDNDRAQRLLPLQAVGSFLPSIPARLGRNAALDAATASLCSVYVDYLTVKPTGSDATIQKYIASLHALQDCVKDADLRTQSETICASILVQICEVRHHITISDNTAPEAML